MSRALPLSVEFRESFILRVDQALDGRDPLTFFQRHVFDRHPHHWANIPRDTRTPLDFYRGVVRYCELSAWSEEPPLIILLLLAFKDFYRPDELIGQIRSDGPFRCHPPGVPFYAARVAAEAPLLNRRKARIAALGFDPEPPPAVAQRVRPKRVLLVKGEISSPTSPSPPSLIPRWLTRSSG